MMAGIVALILVTLTVAFFLGAYVAVALGLTGFALLAVFAERPTWPLLGEIAYGTATDTTLLAIPLFALMGEILVHGGITRRLYQALSGWFAWLPGGLLHTNIAASTLFGAVSGSSVASAATIGSVALPELDRRGYSRRLALGSLAAGGTLGVLIPPSVVLIIYGVMAQVSIGDLFLGGVVPGLLMATLFMVTIALLVGLRRGDTTRSEPRKKLRTLLKDSLPIIPFVILIALVVGTIYLGIATPTESAAFGCIGALVLAAVAGNLRWRTMPQVMLSTASTTGMIFLLLIGAFILQFALGYLGVPAALGQALQATPLNAVTLPLAFAVVFLLLGIVLDELAMVVTIVPIVVPLLTTAGVDPLWFGILIVVLVQTGLIMPPYGMNLFVIHGVQRRVGWGERITAVYRGAMPFVVALLVGIVLLFLFPALVTWLPSTAH